MDAQTLTFLLLAIYALLVLGISWGYRTREKDVGFAIGARKVGLWPTIGSLIGGFRDGGGVAIWVFAGAAFYYPLYWVIIGATGAFLVYTFLSPFLRRLGAKKNYITQSDFIKDRLGPLTEKSHVCIILFFATLAASGQLYVSGLILSLVGDIPKVYGILISALIVIAYLRMGGYKTLIVTDLFQWILMSAIVIAPFFLLDLPPAEKVSEAFFATPASFASSLGLLVMFMTLALPDVWQRIFSLKDEKTGQKAFLLVGPLFFIVTAGLSVFGFYLGTGVEDITSVNVLEKIFTSDALPPMILAFAAVAVAAIAMSTLDTMTYIFTSTLAKNLYRIDPTKEHDRYVRFVRRSILFFLIPLVALAYGIEDIIMFIIDSYSIVGIALPILIYGIIRPTKLTDQQDKILAAGTLACSVLYLGMFFSGGFVNFWYNLIPTGALALVVISQHLLFKKT